MPPKLIFNASSSCSSNIVVVFKIISAMISAQSSQNENWDERCAGDHLEKINTFISAAKQSDFYIITSTCVDDLQDTGNEISWFKLDLLVNTDTQPTLSCLFKINWGIIIQSQWIPPVGQKTFKDSAAMSVSHRSQS